MLPVPLLLSVPSYQVDAGSRKTLAKPRPSQSPFTRKNRRAAAAARMRKKVDERIRTLIENGVRQRQRSMFIIVGDKSRDQIVNLNYMLAKSRVKSRPSVLWCYRNKLEISSHRKKRAKQIKKLMQRGLMDPEKADPFSLFLETSDITYCMYKDSERVLGNTFGMCILQDFEALTPNLLARTIETVEGGGLVILLLSSLSSLTSLYTMVMDVHERFRTESHTQAATRFNERFLLSIASCKACIVMDDELNILPISSHMKFIQPFKKNEDSEGLSERERELKDLKDQFREDFPVGPLIGKCCTMDQGKAVINFLDSILDKSLRSTVALLAARGRGKSAALGLAIAGAIAAGYSNIFVTAPSPENLNTLFDFVCKGLNAMEYKEHLHYDVVKSSDPNLRKAIIQINVHKQHRQTIQYMKPHDHGKLSQVELLVIDEAAAIPLPIVKALLGPYLVFLSSTVNGYEGTGRSLSLKLLQQLESQSQPSASSDGPSSSRLFKKIELNESIRYASGDPIETWLNELLCLDLANSIPNISRLPHPEHCQLYYVNRDTLFSYHKESEVFLQRMMALYVASHYKNSPNDLQLMADAPAHHLFVLLGPVNESENQLPDILCVIQVCLEGQISQKSAIRSLNEGHAPSGDQIPWKFCEQFQDNVFPSLSGARIVRIAVHPSALRLGYGSAAVKLLSSYYQGEMTVFKDAEEDEEPDVTVSEAAEKASLLEESIKPRANLPPLLVNLEDRRPEKLHYLGVSFGLTQELFRFWRKHSFYPFYVGQIPSAVTGEHTCMALSPLNSDDIKAGDSIQLGFLEPFYKDFRQRFRRLLGTSFRHLNFKLAMSVLASKIDFSHHEPSEHDTSTTLKLLRDVLSPHDMKRLEAYSNNLVDYHLILDLVPILAHEYFSEKLPVTLHGAQASVLFCMGLQDKDIGATKEELGIEREQVLSNFIKTMKKLYGYLNNTAGKEIEATLPRLKEIEAPLSRSMDEDLDEAAQEVKEKRRVADEATVDPKLLQKYAIKSDGHEIEKALQNEKLSASGVISVKSSKSSADKKEKHRENEKSKRKGQDSGRSEKKKKRT
ncbi:RNA cytidine acetyltransferase 1-like [Triticum dicoccoides]|uniref:RNA cytidine acetyltransferase 1-like n=1 Tax=Triticum dicoccoides TaxID=85692 RepID=UPI00188E3FA5|nr:RNA cytidine acetyltransferase 1-like [Triticum dicoccoides]